MREVMIENRGEREWVSLEEARGVAYRHANKMCYSLTSFFCGAVFIASTVLTTLSFQGSLPDEASSTGVKVLLIALSIFSGLGTGYSCWGCCRIPGTLCCPDKRVVIEGDEGEEHINTRLRCSIQ